MRFLVLNIVACRNTVFRYCQGIAYQVRYNVISTAWKGRFFVAGYNGSYDTERENTSRHLSVFVRVLRGCEVLAGICVRLEAGMAIDSSSKGYHFA